MNEIVSMTMPVPVRANTIDNPGDILGFAIEAYRCGGAALATLVGIRGGAARALGSQVAVAADGRFCGYVSGGCVETAVAAEALQAIAQGSDRTLAFGEGSPFFDIVLPCGGGISVAIHVLRGDDPLRAVLRELSARRPVALRYSPLLQRLMLSNRSTERSGWHDVEFFSVYRPQTRLVISGQAGEVDAVRRLAVSAGYDVLVVDRSTLRGQGSIEIDQFTAVVLLHHDLDMESHVLSQALASPAFYIGALGSTRTHRRRVERLLQFGIASDSLDRIKAPIGMFGPTRDATSLAISVLADITAARLQAFA